MPNVHFTNIESASLDEFRPSHSYPCPEDFTVNLIVVPKAGQQGPGRQQPVPVRCHVRTLGRIIVIVFIRLRSIHLANNVDEEYGIRRQQPLEYLSFGFETEGRKESPLQTSDPLPPDGVSVWLDHLKGGLEVMP